MVTNGASNAIGRITTSGAISTFTSAGVFGPAGITAGPDANLGYTVGDTSTIVEAFPPT